MQSESGSLSNGGTETVLLQHALNVKCDGASLGRERWNVSEMIQPVSEPILAVRILIPCLTLPFQGVEQD